MLPRTRPQKRLYAVGTAVWGALTIAFIVLARPSAEDLSFTPLALALALAVSLLVLRLFAGLEAAPAKAGGWSTRMVAKLPPPTEIARKMPWDKKAFAAAEAEAARRSPRQQETVGDQVADHGHQPRT